MNAASLQVNTVTIEVWLKKHSDSEYGVYVAKNIQVGGGSGTSWFELLHSHHNGQVEFRVTSDGAPAVLSTSALALDNLDYVVATYDGAVAKLYVNGKLDGELQEAVGPKQTADPL